MKGLIILVKSCVGLLKVCQQSLTNLQQTNAVTCNNGCGQANGAMIITQAAAQTLPFTVDVEVNLTGHAQYWSKARMLYSKC